MNSAIPITKGLAKSLYSEAGSHGVRLILLLPLAVYAIAAAWLGYEFRDQINPDAISYIRNARYIAEGHFSRSVSGYWSPLLSWCIAPLVYLGMDALYAAKAVMVTWGAVLMMSCYALIRSFRIQSVVLRIIALLVIAVVVARGVAIEIAPDVILFAVLMTYSAIILSDNFLDRWWLQLAVGILGGIAYLAKSYGLPFFIVHSAVSICLVTLWRTNHFEISSAARAWAIGLLGLLLFAGPWIAVLSHKYEQPTVSTVARVAHTIVGPPDKFRYHPLDNALYRIPEGRISAWETPDGLQYNHWSPFERSDYLIHQLRVVFVNTRSIIESLGAYDAFRFTIPMLLFLPVLFLGLGDSFGSRVSLWVLGTAAIYAGGFAPIYFHERYTFFLLWPICCIYCLCFAPERLRPVAAKLGIPRAFGRMLTGIVIVSFLAAATVREAVHLRTQYSRGYSTYRLLGEQIRDGGLKGPVVGIGSWFESLAVAYHADMAYSGMLCSVDVLEMEALLREFEVRSVLVRREGEKAEECARAFSLETTWVLELTMAGGRDTWMVYVPPVD